MEYSKSLLICQFVGTSVETYLSKVLGDMNIPNKMNKLAAPKLVPQVWAIQLVHLNVSGWNFDQAALGILAELTCQKHVNTITLLCTKNYTVHDSQFTLMCILEKPLLYYNELQCALRPEHAGKISLIFETKDTIRNSCRKPRFARRFRVGVDFRALGCFRVWCWVPSPVI